MVKKRSVETDYQFYDPPEEIWRKINRPYPYKRSIDRLRIRDLALMSTIYLTSSRIREITGGETIGGELPGIKRKNFYDFGDFVRIRFIPIIKRSDKRITHYLDYPFRQEIKLPKKGFISNFTRAILAWLELIDKDRDTLVFPITDRRAYQIVRTTTGEFPHYLREMGLKFWLRIYDKDVVRLKGFSGHVRIENLLRYLIEFGEEEEERLLNYGSKT